MNQEDILKMAREAGAAKFYPERQSKTVENYLVGQEFLERFAALVAEKAEQDAREAFAKRCEEKSDYWLGQCDTTSAALESCAISLRARGS